MLRIDGPLKEGSNDWKGTVLIEIPSYKYIGYHYWTIYESAGPIRRRQWETRMAQKGYVSMCITHVRYIICSKTYLKRVTVVAQHPRRLRVASVASALALIDAWRVLDVSRPRLDGWGYGNEGSRSGWRQVSTVWLACLRFVGKFYVAGRRVIGGA
jgi:hypothetical protein